MILLPNNLRPKGLYKKLNLGIDLPAAFYQDIKGIDNDLYFIYHEVETLWEDRMTEYYGSLIDPKWTIHCDLSGREIWGCPLTLPDGSYKLENRWHIWSLARDKGWSHVSNIASTEPSHLLRIVRRLWKEKMYKAKYGAIEWNHKMRRDDEDLEARKQDAKDQQFRDIQGENKALTRKAMENLERGIVAPTNPTREIITSYSGQTNHTKIIRPLTDKEGGLIVE